MHGFGVYADQMEKKGFWGIKERLKCRGPSPSAKTASLHPNPKYKLSNLTVMSSMA